MITKIFCFAFPLNVTAIAGTALWSLALCLGFSPLTEMVMGKVTRWLGVAERQFYSSDEDFESSRTTRESQNLFLASVGSIVPFMVVGGLLNWGVQMGLGDSWSISVGIIAVLSCGVYELGRRDNEEN